MNRRIMRVVPAFLAALLLALPGTPAAAATPPANVIAIPPPGEDRDETRTVGPESLRDFSIDRPAQPAPVTVPPTTTAPQSEGAIPPPLTFPDPSESSQGVERAPAAPAQRAPTPQVQAPPALEDALPDASVDVPQIEVPDGEVAPDATEPVAIEPRALDFDEVETGAFPAGWWALVILPVLATFAAFIAIRRRMKSRPAVSKAAPLQASPPPAPTPDAAPAAEPARPNPLADLAPAASKPKPTTAPAPAAAPAPAPAPPSGGIVSTGLKPQLVMNILPSRATLDDEQFWVEFRVEMGNDGTAAAHDVRVEAAILNAGPDQDQAITSFGNLPPPPKDAPGVPVVQIAQGLAFQRRASAPLANLRALNTGDRQIIAPLLALRLSYAKRPGGEPIMVEQRTFLIGRPGGSDGRMAPIRIDTGPRLYREIMLKPA